jgi:hypothetical protein
MHNPTCQAIPQSKSKYNYKSCGNTNILCAISENRFVLRKCFTSMSSSRLTTLPDHVRFSSLCTGFVSPKRVFVTQIIVHLESAVNGSRKVRSFCLTNCLKLCITKRPQTMNSGLLVLQLLQWQAAGQLAVRMATTCARTKDAISS